MALSKAVMPLERSSETRWEAGAGAAGPVISLCSRSWTIIGRWCAACSTVASPRWPWLPEREILRLVSASFVQNHGGARLFFFASPKERTVEDTRERPLLPVHVDLLHDEAVLRVVACAGLECDGICEVAARGVENGALWLCEGGEAVGEVVFGERHKGAAQGRVVGPLRELDLHLCNDGDAAHECAFVCWIIS
jgi:hypothetical protein